MAEWNSLLKNDFLKQSSDSHNMERLNRKTAPEETHLYPERIVQFGEGNFLRGFFDWMVARMNRACGFHSGVVVVQPRAGGKGWMLNEQEGLFHVNLQGLLEGKPVDSIEMVDVVTRAVDPYREFDEYLALAAKPELRFVVSNTTEAGITFDPTCRLDDRPALSYPGKLTQLLYHRFKTFEGDEQKGLVILPCELIFHNGDELKHCIEQYIELWRLGEPFEKWFHQHCPIYNTLVDRIVPGYPQETIEALQERCGVEDRLMVKAEPYHLWVIEAPDPLAAEFPASRAGRNVLFTHNEELYHRRKVTLLNGPHTLLSPVGYLSGLDTVRQCVEDERVGEYVQRVMMQELLPTLDLPREELTEYACGVMERFKNPSIHHYLTSIMLNSFPKFKARDLPALKRYLEQQGCVPIGIVTGLAAIITYYKGESRGTATAQPQDAPETLKLLTSLWGDGDLSALARGVLSARFIWDEDLNPIPGLSLLLERQLRSIQEKGMRGALGEMGLNEVQP